MYYMHSKVMLCTTQEWWLIVYRTATQIILHVHMPTYCHMFDEVFSRGLPFQFGTMYLVRGV